MAVQRDFDIGILMSTDTGMKPALEAVAELSSNQAPAQKVAAPCATRPPQPKAVGQHPELVLPLGRQRRVPPHRRHHQLRPTNPNLSDVVATVFLFPRAASITGPAAATGLITDVSARCLLR
jgi:hypothetical protein